MNVIIEIDNTNYSHHLILVDNNSQSLDSYIFATCVKYPSKDKPNIVKSVKLVLMALITIVYGLGNVLERKICGSLNSSYALSLLPLYMRLFYPSKVLGFKKSHDVLFFFFNNFFNYLFFFVCFFWF